MRSSFKKNKLLVCWFLTAFLVMPGAQTILVHSPSPGEDQDEELLKILQSAESGIMDALFERGCIVFSDVSDVDGGALKRLASKVGSDYILSWELAEAALTGRLDPLAGDAAGTSLTIYEDELNSSNLNREDLYVALGEKLGESLVAGQW